MLINQFLPNDLTRENRYEIINGKVTYDGGCVSTIYKITEKHKQHFSKKEVKKEDKYINDDDDNNDDDDIEQESLF